MTALREDDPGARAYRAEMEDGVIEILMAFFLLVPAITAGKPGFAWMVVLPILLGRKLVHRIRNRLIYPRIGFVEAERETRRQLFGGMALWAVGAVAVVAAVLFFWSNPRDPAIFLSWSPGPHGYERIQIFLFVMSMLLLSSGLVFLGRFVRRHPVLEPPLESADDV